MKHRSLTSDKMQTNCNGTLGVLLRHPAVCRATLLMKSTGYTKPGTVNAGLLPCTGESVAEGLGYGCLECLILQQVTVDCVGSPGAVLLDVL